MFTLTFRDVEDVSLAPTAPCQIRPRLRTRYYVVRILYHCVTNALSPSRHLLSTQPIGLATKESNFISGGPVKSPLRPGTTRCYTAFGQTGMLHVICKFRTLDLLFLSPPSFVGSTTVRYAIERRAACRLLLPSLAPTNTSASFPPNPHTPASTIEEVITTATYCAGLTSGASESPESIR